MADETFEVGFKGTDQGFGGAAKRAVAEIGNIRSAINSLPATAISNLGSAMASVFSVNYLQGKIKESIAFGASINDMAQRIGVSTDFMQELAYAAEQTGGSVRDVTIAIKEMQRSQIEALRNPRGQDAAAFREMKIDPKTANKEEMWNKVSDAIGTGANNASTMSAAVTLLGRSAMSVLPMMKEGFSGLAAEFRSLGATIDKDLIQKLDAADDKIKQFKVREKAGWAVGGGVAARIGNFAVDATEGYMVGAKTAWDKFKEHGSFIAAAIAGFKGTQAAAGMQVTEENDRKKTLEERRNNAGASVPLTVPQQVGGSISNGGAGTSHPTSDALQRIGLFIGGSGGSADIAKRHLETSRDLLAETRNMVRTMNAKW